MKTLKPKSIFLFTNTSYSSLSSHLLSPYNPLKTGHFHFSSSPSSSSSSSWKHHDEESKNVKVSVWWDFENCQIPGGANVVKVAQTITSALRSNGIKGPVSITAFGDVTQLSRSNQEALSSTGICISHVPSGGKNSADRSLLMDLVYWTSQNPPPAHLLLISGDRDFANILHRLRMSNYNILLASTEHAPDVLCSAASIMWSWNSLVRGVSLTGRHFNQPPDGPYGSWYGHYKGPLEDPFSVMEQPAISKLVNSADPSTYTKPCPLPKPLLNKICQIVKAHPNGIAISEVKSELVKAKLLDKDFFFGHRKFSHLLKTLPDVLKLQRKQDGQIFVHGIQREAAGSVESTSKMPRGFETNKNDRDYSAAAELSRDESPMVADATETSLSPPVDPRKEDLPPVHYASTTVCSSNPVEEALKLSHSNEPSCNVYVKSCITFDGSERTTSEVESAESRSHHRDPLDPNPSSSSDVNKSVLEEKNANSSREDDSDPDVSTGFFHKILNWFRFWRTSPNADHASGEVGKDVTHISGQSENNELLPTNADHASEKAGKEESRINRQAENLELFSTNSFWDEVESFVCSIRGSFHISQSRTRLEMAERLRKEGPSVLNTLNSSALLHLTDLLISEKRWVEECSSQEFPFKLSHPANKLSSNPRRQNGLSAMFSGKPSVGNLQRLPNHEREKGDLNHAKTGDNLYNGNGKPSGVSKSQMLMDCQNLLAEILKEHPEGFNMGRFKELFLEKYGYALKCQMLGHLKLSSLLQTMPGVTIESSHVIPSGKVPRDFSMECTVPNNSTGKLSSLANGLSNSVGNDDDDSAWEELGPVSRRNSNGNVTESNLNRKTNLDTSDSGDSKYSSLSDDEFSDSDTKYPTEDWQDRPQKPRSKEENSSLLNILDSWYTSKEGKSYQDQQKSEDEFVGCSRNDSKPMDMSIDFDSISHAPFGRNTKLRRNYSFVTDKGEDNKDQLIDGILGSLKKSAESRVQN